MRHRQSVGPGHSLTVPSFGASTVHVANCARESQAGRTLAKTTLTYDAFKIVVTDAGSAGVFVVASLVEPTRDQHDIYRLYRVIAMVLVAKKALPVQERVFATASLSERIVVSRRCAFSATGIDPETPLTVVEGRPPWGGGISGILIHAVQPIRVGPVTAVKSRNATGRRWRTKSAEYLVLQMGGRGLESSEGHADIEAHAREIFDDAERMLVSEGFSFCDVARTWFYIRDIVRNYGAFNRARNQKFARLNLMPKPGDRVRLPASTAIGAAPMNGSALIADILAVKSTSQLGTRRLSNPGQKDAFDYGASFSRATVIEERDVNLIQVSGIAAVGESGETLHPGNAAAQIACTLDKAEALLGVESAHLNQTVAANIFVKSAEMYNLFHTMAKCRGLKHFPAVALVADVCRDDLLFEMDLEVLVPKTDIE